MVQVYVHALDASKKPVVADRFEFENLPRKGDEVVVDLSKKQYVLEVQVVRHFNIAESKLASMREPAHLECKLIDCVNI